MQFPDFNLNQREFSYFLSGGQAAYEKSLAAKKLQDKYDFLKFRPETHGYEPAEHLTEEGKVLLEFIRLHKSKEINLNQLLPYLKDLTPYSQGLETHLTLFKNLCLVFSSGKNSQILKSLIDKMEVVGSVLLQEMDYKRSIIEDKVDTVATFTEGKFVINTPADKAKVCKYFTPHSTHVLLFARIKTSEGNLTAAYPFFVPLRDPKTLELNKGITMKWLGPSFGGISGREYAFEFKDFVIPFDKITLDKHLGYSDNKLQVKAEDMVIDYTIRVCLLLEQERRVEKSVSEALKAGYLTVRHSNNRTQFKTLDEKGKERPIFDYNYNKTRIVKGLVEIINLHNACTVLKRGLYFAASNPQKNFATLKDFFVFYDMFEAYVNERCLVVIEAFRESLGGIGFLKFSGIPTLQENAIKNAAMTGPNKELNYIKFAQFFVNVDLNEPGDFISNCAGWLVENTDLDHITKEEKYEQKPSYFTYFMNKKLLYYRKKLQESGSLNADEDPAKLLQTLTNFEDISKLCETFVLYVKNFCFAVKVGVNLNRSNLREIFIIIFIEILSNLQDDLPFYLSHEDKLWPKGKLETMNHLLVTYIDQVGSQSLQIIESFGFDENMLHSCISKTADETYEKMLNMSKHHNPRNDPKAHEEIRRQLLAFLNRPEKSKL